MNVSLPLWHVDAFTSHRFGGNPAAVILLPRWLPDAKLQNLAREEGLNATAFLVPEGEAFRIRWFTPVVELPLCGHATLAAGWVVLNRLTPEADEAVFHSATDQLTVRRVDQRLTLAMPRNDVEPALLPPALSAALGKPPREFYKGGTYWLAIYENESDIRELRPDPAAIQALEAKGVIVSAPGTDSDFVSRFFAPALGIAEDPVTGSAHTRLVPYWARRLSRSQLFARQLSARGGEIWCELAADQVLLSGHSVLHLKGTVEYPCDLTEDCPAEEPHVRARPRVHQRARSRARASVL